MHFPPDVGPLFLLLASAPQLESEWEERRLVTPEGAIHVLAPAEPGPLDVTVIYIHGYYTGVDQAWSDHHLAAQLIASGERALFIAPEAPRGPGEPLNWPSLDALLERVRSDLATALPAGPIILIGHSGAYRTLRTWLDDPRVTRVILLDALYGDPAAFRRWLVADRSRSLAIVSHSTWPRAQHFCAELAPLARGRLDCVHSLLSHFEIITSGEVIARILAPPSRPQPTAAASDR